MKKNVYAGSKIVLGLLCLLGNMTLVPGNFTLENKTDKTIAFKYKKTWCDQWGDLKNIFELATAHAADIIIFGGTIYLLASVARAIKNKGEVKLMTLACTKGGSEDVEETIAPYGTFTDGKLGVWFDVELLDPAVVFEGQQKEIYSKFHTPADGNWKLAITPL